MVVVYKLYVRHCEPVCELVKTGSYLGYRIEAEGIRHLFKLEKGPSTLKPFRALVRGVDGGSVKLNRRKSLIVYSPPSCVALSLLREFHILGFRILKRYVVIHVALSRRSDLRRVRKILGDRLLLVEEVSLDEVSLSPGEEELARVLLENGYFEYPRRASIDVISTVMGKSKSGLSYNIRRILKKSLNIVV